MKYSVPQNCKWTYYAPGCIPVLGTQQALSKYLLNEWTHVHRDSLPPVIIRTVTYSWQVLLLWGTELLSRDCNLNCMAFIHCIFSIPKWCHFLFVSTVVFLILTVVQNQQLSWFQQRSAKLFQHILLPHVLVSWKQNQRRTLSMGELSNVLMIIEWQTIQVEFFIAFENWACQDTTDQEMES